MKPKLKTSLTMRLGIMIAVFVVATTAAIGATLLELERQEVVGHTTDMAARQRMLNQRFTAEIMEGLAHRHTVSLARELGGALTQQVVADRAKYTAAVVAKLKAEAPGVTIRSDYEGVPGAVPLPATLVRETAELVSTSEQASYSLALRSKWNVHPRQGLQSEFERRAWDHLWGNETSNSYWELERKADGVDLHFARADVGSAPGCIECHNKLEGAPKTDYRLGDLMGLLVVTTPVVHSTNAIDSVMAVHDRGAPPPGSDTRELFTTTLSALREGGPAFTDISMTQTVELAPAEDPAFLAALEEVEAEWTGLTVLADELLATDFSGDTYAEGVRELRERGDRVLAAAHASVRVLETKSHATMGTVKTIQYTAAGVTLLAFLGIMTYLRRRVSAPVQDVLAKVRKGADESAREADLLLRTSRSVSEGATRQASAIQESSASLDQMASMTKQTAENAQDAKRIMADGSALIETAQSSMDRLSEAIGEIKRASDETARVARTIEQIASQTNLLALNAAVEAARAGEAGEGFAVVAEEVRSLAQRAGEAARETATMIDSALRSAEGGVAAADETRDALVSVVGNQREVAEIVARIATANGEQADGVHQVSVGVEQLDQIMNRNAGDAGASMRACEDLAQQTEIVRSAVDNLVDVFGLGQRAPNLDPAKRRPAPERPDANVIELAAAPQPRAAPRHIRSGTTASAAAEKLIPFDDNAKALSEF